MCRLNAVSVDTGETIRDTAVGAERAPVPTRVSDTGVQRPVNAGGRFSIKAAMPSR
jgi:hypothetical protein